MTREFHRRERAVVIYMNGTLAGHVEIDRNNFIHFQIREDFRRQGLMTEAVDYLREIYEPRWCDDPAVVDSSCFMTENGQAFADAYRTSRGLPLSTMMWVPCGEWGRELQPRIA